MLSVPGCLVPSPVALFQQLLGSLVEELTVAEEHLDLDKYNLVVAFVVLAENDPACGLLLWANMRFFSSFCNRFFSRFFNRFVIRVIFGLGVFCYEQEGQFVAILLPNYRLDYLLHGFEKPHGEVFDVYQAIEAVRLDNRASSRCWCIIEIASIRVEFEVLCSHANMTLITRHLVLTVSLIRAIIDNILVVASSDT